MVRRATQITSACPHHRLLQCLHRVLGFKRRRHYKTEDGTRVVIGYQMQVTRIASLQRDISDIGHPKRVYMIDIHIFSKIRILKIQVVRVGRVACTAWRNNQMMLAHQVQKIVPCIPPSLAHDNRLTIISERNRKFFQESIIVVQLLLRCLSKRDILLFWVRIL